MDPETELSTRENMEWRREVDCCLSDIRTALSKFHADSWNGNLVRAILNDCADKLSELGWHGDRIPF